MSSIPTDVITVVYAFAAPLVVRHARYACSRWQAAFDQAVHQMQLPLAWHRDRGVTLDRLHRGDVAGLAPVEIDRTTFRLRNAAKYDRGTLLVNIFMLTDAAGDVPPNFLSEVQVETIIVHDKGSVRSVGTHWISGCPSLTSLELVGLHGLTRVEEWWCAACPALTAFDASSLTALTSVGSS